MLLCCGSKLCMAQQEDTLRLKYPSPKPELIVPNQLMQPTQTLIPSKLGIDGLEYTPTSQATKDTVEIVPYLSVENFLKFYYQDFLTWEKDTYGVNFDIQNFVMKNGRYIEKSKFIPRKRGRTEAPLEAPYPLSHLPLISVNLDKMQVGAKLAIPISWKPSKQDIWFKENFGWEKRAVRLMSSQVDSFDNRSIYEVESLLRVDSIIQQNKLDSTGQHSPVPVKYKKEIDRIRKNIRKSAKHDFK